MFPILDESLKKRVMEEVLGTMRSDNCKAWLLKPNAIYERIQAEGTVVRSQSRFMDLARERARESEALLGLQSKPLTLTTTPRALDKLRRRATKKRKRKTREE